jgi:hypothetical protein
MGQNAYLKLYLFFIKSYGGVEVLLHKFLSLALGGEELSASRPDCFATKDRALEPVWRY